MDLLSFSFPRIPVPHNGAREHMTTKVPLSELTDRMQRFRARMDAENPNWELAAFFGRVNQYYFTGTMQDGVLLVPRDGEAVFCVRRSFERAGARIALSEHPPDEKLSRRRARGAGGSDTTGHSPRNRAGPGRPGPAVPKVFPLQRGRLAGRADRPGAGGQKPVRTGHHGTVRRRCTGGSWRRACRRCCARG